MRYSYRHAWNLIHKWFPAFFGVPLADTAQGKGASLTPLRELAWQVQRIGVGAWSQLDNLGAEIDLELLRAINRPSLGSAYILYGYAYCPPARVDAAG